MTTKLDIIATIISKVGMEAKVLAAVEACIAPSRAEAGCEMYKFYKDTEIAGKFVFIETWADKAALDHHMTLPHFIKLADTLTPLLEDGFHVEMLEHVF